MRLATREPLFLDVKAILREPSDITRAEMEATGGHAEWLRDLRDDIAHPDGGGFTLTANGRPIGVYTHVPAPGSNERLASWAAREDYYQLGGRGTLATSRRLAEEFRRYPNSVFVSRTTSQHPRLARWFAAHRLYPAGQPGTFKGGLHV